ncbi:DUF4870 domain-containing protein [Olivibacter sp. SDN3]|uniref:DUF4870 domain-containing protein n=1 Tax=Olivibacter sp. SDN3 TaxID=2764720 RepID=UPI00165149B6|nr:DUF4870 domain-containing protein [Olivibacter sp. SDN3]QNL51699.1 DUF4870 domain-containing protein [Olivibacter sp. SDN3]
MTNKTVAMVAYITIIGWVIAYLTYKKSTEKNTLINYHLGQSLGIIIISVVLSVISVVVLAIVPALGSLFYLISLIPFVFMLLGIIAASNETERPVPLVGKIFEGKFSF